MIAGLPPIYGLYAALISQFIHGLMGTSRHPAVGPVALDSLVVAIALGALSITKVDDVITAAIFFSSNGWSFTNSDGIVAHGSVGKLPLATCY